MNKLRRLLGNSSGASAVEFALLAGPFLLLLFGSVEFSRGLWTRQALLDVTASAVRCVAVLQHECVDQAGVYSLAATKTFIADAARGLGVTLSDSIVVQDNTSCDGLDGFALVALQARFDSVFPIDKVITFSSQSCFARQE